MFLWLGTVQEFIVQMWLPYTYVYVNNTCILFMYISQIALYHSTIAEFLTQFCTISFEYFPVPDEDFVAVAIQCFTNKLRYVLLHYKWSDFLFLDEHHVRFKHISFPYGDFSKSRIQFCIVSTVEHRKGISNTYSIFFLKLPDFILYFLQVFRCPKWSRKWCHV